MSAVRGEGQGGVGPPPTGTLWVSVPVSVRITETRSAPAVATYSVRPSGVTAGPRGA